jgi:hypothetical protein
VSLPPGLRVSPTKKPGLLRRSGFLFFLLLFSLERDGAGGASVGTGAALGALIGIDGVDIALRDSTNGTFVDTSAACYAVFTNFVSHSFLYLFN